MSTSTTGGGFTIVNKAIYFGTLFLTLLLLIIGLATLEWRVLTIGGTKVSIGLKQSRAAGTTSDISSDGDGADYLAGANTALAFGILAIFALVANMIIGGLPAKFQEITGGKARMIVLICSIAAGVLIILGTIIYAAKLPASIKDPSDYGFSFVLYIISGLFSLGFAVFVFIKKEIF